MKKICLKTWSVLCGVLFTLTLQAQSFSISPTSGKQGETLKVTITGTNTQFGQGSSCLSPTCNDLNSLFIFGAGSSTMTSTFFTYSTLVKDSTNAEVEIRIPYNIPSGIYSAKLRDNISSENMFTVIAQEPPKVAYISFSPDTAEVNKPLTVTITGVNTKIGQSDTCTSINGCTNVGSYFTYYYQGSPSFAISGTLPFSDYNQINDSVAIVKFIAPPNAGNCFIITQWGKNMSNLLHIVDKNNPSFSFTPNIGTENSELNILITGNNTKIGQGVTCQNDTNCKVIGNTFYSSSNVAFPILEYNQIDEYSANAKIKLPSQGNYSYLSTQSDIRSTNPIIVNAKPVPSFSFTPNVGETNTSLVVTITGVNTTIGQGTSCKSSNGCTNLGNQLKFTAQTQASSTISGELPILNYLQIDSVTAQITIKPTLQGNYVFSTDSGIISSTYLQIVTKPTPVFSLNKETWEENTLLNTIIYGNATKIGRGIDCNRANQCEFIGDTIYFTRSEFDTNYVYRSIIQSYEQIDESSARISFLTPDSGIYYMNIDKSIFSISTLNLTKQENLTSTINGSSMYCKGNNLANFNVNFTSLPPWKITFTDGSDTTSIADIYENPYSYYKNIDSSVTYKLLNVSNIRGAGIVSGEAAFTLLNDTIPTANLSRVDSAINNNSVHLKIELTGKAPWEVGLNNGLSDSVISIIETPLIIVLKPTTFTTYFLNYVIDNSFCGNGSAYGSVNYGPGDIVTDLNSFDYTSQTNIYPNPTAGIVNLENAISATLFNSLGEEILKTTGTKIDISHMPNGLYYIQALDAKNKLSLVKIVKE